MSEFLGSYYYYTKGWILFLFGIMIDTGQKFLSALMTLRARSQTWNLNVKVFVKVFKTSLFSNFITDSFIFGMVIHIGPKFCAVPSPPP